MFNYRWKMADNTTVQTTKDPFTVTNNAIFRQNLVNTGSAATVRKSREMANVTELVTEDGELLERKGKMLFCDKLPVFRITVRILIKEWVPLSALTPPVTEE